MKVFDLLTPEGAIATNEELESAFGVLSEVVKLYNMDDIEDVGLFFKSITEGLRQAAVQTSLESGVAFSVIGIAELIKIGWHLGVVDVDSESDSPGDNGVG